MQTQFNELTDAQWTLIMPYLPMKRKRKHDLRIIFNAILSINRTGTQWRNSDSRYPYWEIVYYYFRVWTKSGIIDTINTELVKLERERQGRTAEPTANTIDSQTVKIAPFIPDDKSIDGGKKINGRKRHLLVDTLGIVIGVLVTAANVSDGKAGCLLLNRCSDKFGRLKKILVDGVYAGTFMDYARTQFNVAVEISSRPPTSKGFVPIKKRWVNERSFGWLNFFRRLHKDHEKSTKSSEAMILIANIQILLARFDS